MREASLKCPGIPVLSSHSDDCVYGGSNSESFETQRSDLRMSRPRRLGRPGRGIRQVQSGRYHEGYERQGNALPRLVDCRRTKQRQGSRTSGSAWSRRRDLTLKGRALSSSRQLAAQVACVRHHLLDAKTEASRPIPYRLAGGRRQAGSPAVNGSSMRTA